MTQTIDTASTGPVLSWEYLERLTPDSYNGLSGQQQAAIVEWMLNPRNTPNVIEARQARERQAQRLAEQARQVSQQQSSDNAPVTLEYIAQLTEASYAQLSRKRRDEIQNWLAGSDKWTWAGKS